MSHQNSSKTLNEEWESLLKKISSILLNQTTNDTEIDNDILVSIEFATFVTFSATICFIIFEVYFCYLFFKVRSLLHNSYFFQTYINAKESFVRVETIPSNNRHLKRI